MKERFPDAVLKRAEEIYIQEGVLPALRLVTEQLPTKTKQENTCVTKAPAANDGVVASGYSDERFYANIEARIKEILGHAPSTLPFHTTDTAVSISTREPYPRFELSAQAQPIDAMAIILRGTIHARTSHDAISLVESVRSALRRVLPDLEGATSEVEGWEWWDGEMLAGEEGAG